MNGHHAAIKGQSKTQARAPQANPSALQRAGSHIQSGIRKADTEHHYLQDSYIQASIYLTAIIYSHSENTCCIEGISIYI